MRTIVTCFHKYQPYGGEFYEPILQSFIERMTKYKDEFDNCIIIDSTWNIDGDALRKLAIKAQVIKVDPSLRYYDAYKKVLPDIPGDYVLFMDNDMIVYKPGKIEETFALLEHGKDYSDVHFDYDVVSIYDTIGTYQTDKLNGKNKLCPYWFATRKNLLMNYLTVDWSPDHMPYTETFGLLTEAMVNDGLRTYEWEEDKTEVKSWNPLETEKTLGYYHVRAGSTPAYLLAEKHYGNKDTYWAYLKNQPKQEIERHCGWYTWMGGDPSEIINDLHEKKFE